MYRLSTLVGNLGACDAMFMFASASTVATVAADGAWSDGIWLANGIVE